MKIKARNQKVHGTKLNVPCDGLIVIGEDGIVEVSENCGNALLTNPIDWEKIEDGKKTVKEEKSEEELFLEGLKEATLEELIEMAKEAGYPEEEYSKFVKKQKLMVAYMTKKFNSEK